MSEFDDRSGSPALHPFRRRGGVLMLELQWNALRVGDRVIVHDDLDAGFAPHEATVRLIRAHEHAANEVALRLDDRPAEIVRPRRQAVHLVPIGSRAACRRCRARTERSTSGDRASS